MKLNSRHQSGLRNSVSLKRQSTPKLDRNSQFSELLNTVGFESDKKQKILLNGVHLKAGRWRYSGKRSQRRWRYSETIIAAALAIITGYIHRENVMTRCPVQMTEHIFFLPRSCFQTRQFFMNEIEFLKKLQYILFDHFSVSM